MDLKTHLYIRTPIIWAATDEAVRVIDEVLAHSQRPIFRMEPLLGFCRWEANKQLWAQVLTLNPMSGEMGPTHELQDALPIVEQAGGTLIIEHAHELPLHRVMTAFSERYRNAVQKNNADTIPVQLILCSYKDEVPPEARRVTIKASVELPTQSQLGILANRVSAGAGLDELDEEMKTRVGRAASGLSESEATNTFLTCLANKSKVDIDFIARAKLDHIKQGGVLEVRTPKVSLNDVGGMDRAKELIDAVSWMWSHPQEAKELQVIPLRRMLMIGLPGGGKSLMAEACAASLGLDLAKGGISSAMSKWIGESEQNVRNMFKQLKAMSPIVFWVDELGRDLSGGASSSETDGGTTDRAHGEFLSGLQEMPEDIFLLAAANRIDHLPPEMTRADRFDKIMFVGFPTENERQDIFKIHLGNSWAEFDIELLAKATPFFTGAEIKALIREVRFDVAASEHRAACTTDLLQRAPLMKGRTWIRHRQDMVRMYERAIGEWDWASREQEAEAQDVLDAAKNKMITLPGGPAAQPVKAYAPPADWTPNFDD